MDKIRMTLFVAGVSIASAALATEELTGLHERIDPQSISASPQESVPDTFIVCTQSEPAALKRRFLIMDNRPRVYSPFDPKGLEFCAAERGVCAAGWYEGDLIYQRDMVSGGVSTMRIDLDTNTLAMTFVFDSGSIVKSTIPCETRQLLKSQ